MIQPFPTGNLIGIIVLIVVLVEIGVRLPFVLTTTGMLSAIKRAGRVVRSARISDHWKERAMLSYSLSTLRASLVLLGCITLLGAVTGIVTLTVAFVVRDFAGFVVSTSGMISICLLAIAYLALRPKFLHV